MVDLPCSFMFGLDAVAPYDFDLTVRKPAGWDLFTPFEVFEDGVLWTAMRTDGGVMLGLKLKSEGTVKSPRVFCEVFSRERLGSAERKRVKEVVAWSLSVHEDLGKFYAQAKHDSLVKMLVRDLYGMRITKRWDIFPRLILAITLQMAPIKRSDQMMNLLIEEYGEKTVFDGREVRYWPSPETIAEAEVKELERRCKLGYRAKALKAVAEEVSKGFPTLKQLEAMTPREAKAKLMELYGIGEYSADIVTLHPGFAVDVWSAKIFSLLLFGKEPESPRKIIPRLKKLAEKRWGEWRGYVFVYVLNDLEKLSKRFKFDLTGL